ncbi:PREDICTED: agamous-like MADS-box protein AGL61 [Lupinus angustifolius]|uniref:agamous-like MADS-box protein AGL61 n=1 Tax=Lupinus angustifolius TaxID=3871 RepID=UPI00092F4782|nr:PREDICTED: agamous-like MADS-box protein AGL61 [Lupinus angustifolius]
MSNSIPSSSNPKKNKGRRRIEMKKIAKDSSLQVTFSKRRTGLFKKASELCTLCDAKVGLVVFSPANKAFSFGDPSIDVVIDRYQMSDQPLNLGNMQYLQELNDKINQINEDLVIEKKCSEELAKQRKEAQERFWWAAPIEEINGERLDQLKLALKNLKKNVLGVVERQNIAEGATTVAVAIPPPPHFFTGGASSSNNPLPPPPQPPTQEFQVQPPPPPQQFAVNPQPEPQQFKQPQPPPQQFMQPQPLPQQFPVYPPPPPPHMLQNQSMMLPNNLFNGGMMNHPAFNNNNMGGYGPASGFF